MNLQNNTILITGGSSGIGYELAKQLLAQNNTVIITGRNTEKLAKTQKELLGIHTFQSDVSDPAAIASLHQKVVGQFPKLNILINNAGEMRKLNLHDASISLEDLTREIDINLSGPIRMIQQFLPQLKAQQEAAILNVTSGLALIPYPISPVYGATKSGLHSYTQSLRVQLKHTNIQVIELLAPSTNTPLNDNFEGDVDPKSMMEPAKVAALALKGLENNTPEIYPGSAKAIKLLSKLAPSFLLKQTSKPVDKMLKG